MSGAEELAFTVRHTVALGDRGSGWNALYTLRISLPSTLSFSLLSSLLLCRRMCTCMQPRYVRIHVYVYIYIYIYIDSSISFFLSFSLLTFVPLLPQEQWIMLFWFTYMRPTVPQFSIQAMHDASDIMRHFGIASQIFSTGSCLFDKVIVLWYFGEFNTVSCRDSRYKCALRFHVKFQNSDTGK